MKICLNCGDTLLDAAKKCPTCGNKKEFVLVDKDDTEKIQEIIASVPHPKEGLTAKWKTSGTMLLMEQKKAKEAPKQRIKENREKGIACCPKCGSTSLSAQKKGFSFIKGALGASIGLDVGMVAGGIGANKIIITCLNCGHQWKPGK